jgi:hypothetical protein
MEEDYGESAVMTVAAWVSTALFNFRVMDSNLDGCGGEPNRLIF